MKVLKSSSEIEVLGYTENYVEAITRAARTCYKSEAKDTASNEKLLRRLIESGHEAMVEMADLTVRFKNISRGFSHEMVRHRLCSFAQESTRYVDESDLHCVVPPHKDHTEGLNADSVYPIGEVISLEDMLSSYEYNYGLLRSKGYAPGDARQVLPIATRTEIVVKANMREWRKIFQLRTAQDAHWEIRETMLKVLSWCKSNMPILVEDFSIQEDYAIQFISNTRLAKLIKDRAKAMNTQTFYVVSEVGNTLNIYEDDRK